VRERPIAGQLVDEVEFPVEEGKVMEFARAVGDVDFHTVPLTFTAVAGRWREQAAMVELLGLELPRIVTAAASGSTTRPSRSATGFAAAGW
jgi:hypothetical protein